jgi:large subunit ribosomal protein L10
MQRTDKEKIVAELTERLRDAETLIVADYRGLTMKEIDALRGQLLQHGARFTVVKNSLTRRAAEEAGAEAVLAMLQGPTAIAFLESEGDPVAVAKALSDAARTTKVLALRGGVLEGRAMSADEVEELAKLPPEDVLRGQVLGAISAPLYAILGLFTAPLQDLHGLIQARIDQLGGDDVVEAVAEPDAPEAEAEAPAAEAPAAEEALATEEDTTPTAEAGPASTEDETEEAAEAVAEAKEEE